ncbi:hypothetical protein ACVIGB_001048 [Bradyrhizobium sp. USDA 4341]
MKPTRKTTIVLILFQLASAITTLAEHIDTIRGPGFEIHFSANRSPPAGGYSPLDGYMQFVMTTDNDAGSVSPYCELGGISKAT